MIDYTTYLSSYQQLIDNHIAVIRNFLANPTVMSSGWEFMESKKFQPKNPFNVFTIISDLYYRENFHSDIIKVFLDPLGNHNEGSTFLFAFLDFLNSNFSDKVSIAKQNYTSAKVERELGKIDIGKIDILISSPTSMHCIIIENKINNAGDMQRQLPRYYDFMIGQGYTIDAIIYLPLNINKTPDQSTWGELDKQHVMPILCIVPAYQKIGVSLVNGWIIPCSQITNNINCISILRQYAELIKLLNNNMMDSVILNKFYQSLLEEKSLETALSVRNMLQELPTFMADRLCDIFKANKGDYNVWKYKPNFCGICFEVSENQYKIDIWTSEKGYSVHVFGQNQSGRFMEWTEDMTSLSSFTRCEYEYSKTDFSFYDEEKVVECVKPIIEEIRKLLFK